MPMSGLDACWEDWGRHSIINETQSMYTWCVSNANIYVHNYFSVCFNLHPAAESLTAAVTAMELWVKIMERAGQLNTNIAHSAKIKMCIALKNTKCLTARNQDSLFPCLLKETPHHCNFSTMALPLHNISLYISSFCSKAAIYSTYILFLSEMSREVYFLKLPLKVWNWEQF